VSSGTARSNGRSCVATAVSTTPHMAAVTPVSQRHSDGCAYYEKIAEGKTLGATGPQPGQRRHLQAPEGRRRPRGRGKRTGPGRAAGERLCRQRGRIAPRTPALRPSHSRT
jgi:hypothetical protein